MKRYFRIISIASGLLLVTVSLLIIFYPRRVSMKVILTEDNFQKEVLESDIPVLVDFWAEWCAPCLMIAPTIEEIAREYSGRLKVGKLNMDENPAVAAKYNIQSIPTLIIFKEGKIIERVIGALPKKALKSKIEMILPTELEEIKKEIERRLERYVRESPYRFNPDKEKVELILSGLAKRKKELGFAYCPCRVPSGDKEEDKKIICPCAYHKEEIAKDGICLCGLFVRKER